MIEGRRYHNKGHFHEAARWRNVPALELDEDKGAPPCRSVMRVEDVFFSPEGDDSRAIPHSVFRRREHAARMACADCTFLVECGLHGLRHEDYGVWGALSEADRRALGGRGQGRPGRRKTVEAVIRRMADAGVPESKVIALLRAWAREKREVA